DQIQAAIHDDPREPRPEGSRQVEAIDVLKRRQEGILDKILRILAIPKEPHPQRHRPGQIALNDPTKRFSVSALNANEKIAILVGAIVRAKHERRPRTVLSRD